MKVVIFLTIILISSCAQTDKSSVQLTEKPKIIIPKREESVSLEKAVISLAKFGELQKLSDFSLPKNDFEIRFWFHQQVLFSGLIIKKSGEKFSGFYVDKIPKKNAKMENRIIYPKSDWQSVIQKLSEADIFTLSDSSKLENYKGDKINDGFSFIIEINKDGVYRIYEYTNPNWAENIEAKQMVELGNIIAEEFDLEEFKPEKIR